VPSDGIIASMDGEFVYVDIYGGGGPPSWQRCKAVLTQKGIWLKYGQKKLSIPLASITSIGRDVSQRISKSFDAYISISYLDKDGEEKLLALAGDDQKHLKRFRLSLVYLQARRMKVFVLHPAEVGGVIQSDSRWRKGVLGIKRRMTDEGDFTDTIIVKPEKGKTIVIPVDDVEKVGTKAQTIGKSEREVITIKYTLEDETYGTYIYSKSSGRLMEYLTEYLHEKGIMMKQSASVMMTGGADKGPSFSQIEEEILVALYSGVSPLEMNSFVEGIDGVDELEAIYDRMIADGLVEVVRLRKEVQLTSKGRGIVNKMMELKVEDETSLF